MAGNEFEILVAKGADNSRAMGALADRIAAIISERTRGNASAAGRMIASLYEEHRDSIETVTLNNSEPKDGEEKSMTTRVATSVTFNETRDGVEVGVSAGSVDDANVVVSQSIGTGTGPSRAVLNKFGVADARESGSGMSKWYMQPTSSLARFEQAVERLFKKRGG